MSRVRVLAGDLVNQIAAGEVVERPASVVKELVENALDAEATRVEVEIRDGGARWICVDDDGCGMGRDDALRAFERHATSKIASQEDLTRVSTLGFRGEALPSIASVARVRMRTRRAGDRIGVELTGEGSGIARVEEAACAPGTRVEVADLFHRIPARLKFLKTPVTEATQIVRWLERIALARPDIRFSLQKDGRPSFLFLPTADPRERAIAVLPPQIGQALVPVEARAARASLMGYATPSGLSRGTSADIHLFVNGRPVRDRLLLHAVRQAYRDALPAGRHPAAVLYLAIQPEDVDVNVHPAKWEVRFRNPGEIRQLIQDGLRRAIGIGRSEAAPPAASHASRVGEPRVWQDFSFEAASGSAQRASAAVDAFPDQAQAMDRADRRPEVPFSEHRYLGQVLGTYLVLERPGAVVLVDQHAAHERVLFERMRQGLLEGKLEAQALLVPVRTELPRGVADAVGRARDSLHAAGFEIEVGEATARGAVRIAIRSVPAALAGRSLDWETMLEETVTQLAEPTRQDERAGLDAALHGVLATASCHAAVRKRDRLERPEVEALLRAIDETLWVPNCPHGRPIALTLDETEIDRRMLRR